MAAARPITVYSPAGALGLYDREAVVQLRLNEDDVDVRPRDDAGALSDLDPANSGTGALTMPQIVDGVLGRARIFDGIANGLAAVDVAPGASLLTRDLSIQLVLGWDVAAQAAAGHPGTLVCRGLGSFLSLAECVAYGLRLDVVDAPSFTGQARWFWQDIAGVDKLQAGAQFTCPPGTYTLLTATRRWMSSTQVRLRYYLGELLLGEVLTADTSIGGGTTGTFDLGTRLVGGVDAQFFAGAIDELLILPRELCAEEIETTWQRLTVYQPRGTALYLQMHDPGYPLPDQPGSDAQLEVRMAGHALGAAASRTEDLRANFLPGRAYGDNLADWEALCLPHPGTGGSIEERRARVLARMRQRRGCSIGGLQDLLASLLGGADPSQLQFIAFSNTWTDDFAAGLNTLRWDISPSPTVSVAAGQLQLQTGAVTSLLPSGWLYARRTVGGDDRSTNGRQAHQIVKLTFTTSTNGSETGIYFGDHARGNYTLLGLRNTGAANYHVFTEVFIGSISQGGAADQGDSGVPVAAVVPIWLHLHQAETFWEVSWSLTSGVVGFGAPIMVASVPPAMYWAGPYMRTTGAATGPLLAKFDDHVLRTPFCLGPFNAYVMLDRVLGFSPDVEPARDVVETIRHAFIHGTFITTPILLAGDGDNGAGVGPCGGY